MITLEKILKGMCAFIGGILGYTFGGFDSLIKTLLIFMVLDYISGVMGAYYSNNLSSNKGFKGILKKIMTLAVIALANMIDKNLIGSDSTIRTMCIMFYISNEAISILENARLLKIPIPEKLKKLIEHFYQENKWFLLFAF